MGEIVPSALSKLIGKDSISSMMDTFRLCSQIGKNIVTIATAAASQEANAYTLDYNDEEAFELAQIMTSDLLDDACGYSSTHDLDTTASMSPHRLCRYEAVSSNQTDVASAQQIFGAHTDTSFVTMIPVAAVPGLEVYDDDLDVWIRPEMIARQHWERQNNNNDNDNDNNNNKEENDHNPPWHCRYIVVLSGEFLQLVTRSMIPCAVHRVVANTGGEARLSAPVLLRARSKMVMDIDKYFGQSPGGIMKDANGDDIIGAELLNDCHGMTMEEIHDVLQP